MYLRAHREIDNQRLREAIFVMRAGMADEEGYKKALALIDGTAGADRHAPLAKDPNRVSLAEQARRKRERKAGSE